MSESYAIDFKPATRVALRGSDFHGVGFELLCAVGDRVEAGAALMRDIRRPRILFTTPAGGRVSKIERGARRRLLSLQIDCDDSSGSVRHERLQSTDQAAAREFMLQTGAWTALRSRPFGAIPDPETRPAALFVTAMDAEPQALPASALLAQYADEFASAIKLLENISDAPLYVCHAPAEAPPMDTAGRAQNVAFSGGYAAGLPGVHIQRLSPIGFGGGEVWHLHYQDAIALGHLALTGEVWQERVISLGGDAIGNPRGLRVRPGASIAELLDGELLQSAARLFDGSPRYGRRMDASENFLGSRQRQLSAIVAVDDPARDAAADLIPTDELETLAPPGIYPVPLMRALQLGDVERARELGALELVEEDLAPLSRACSSNCDYGKLLRAVLDQLEAVG